MLFGPGQRRQIPQIAAGYGRRCLLVTDARMASTPEFQEIAAQLGAAGLTVFLYDGALPDLPRANVMEAAAAQAGRDIDVIVGIGGGSSMDLAKSVSAVLAHGGDVRDYYGEFQVPGPTLPVITVPTTVEPVRRSPASPSCSTRSAGRRWRSPTSGSSRSRRSSIPS